MRFAPLFVPLGTALVVALSCLSGCRTPPCDLTGNNSVHGDALVLTPSRNCVAEVSGTVEAARGRAFVGVYCGDAGDKDPRATSKQTFWVTLPDPRTWDDRTTATASEGAHAANGSASGTSVTTFELREAVGSQAPLPGAATDDFLRHAVLHIVPGREDALDVDVTIRAADLRTPEEVCFAAD